MYSNIQDAHTLHENKLQQKQQKKKTKRKQATIVFHGGSHVTRLHGTVWTHNTHILCIEDVHTHTHTFHHPLMSHHTAAK